jgi:hypothetical protein
VANGLSYLCSSRYLTAAEKVIAFVAVEVRDDCPFAASSPESRIGLRDSKFDNNAS